MDPAPVVVALKGKALLETPHARLRVGAPLESFEAALALPDGARVEYEPKVPGEPARRDLAVDPTLRGNAFRPLLDSPRAQAALLSIAASRRMESGPQSERVFVILRGSGLVFLESGDQLRFGPADAAVVPAGEPARVWAQGPEDVLAVVLQPRGEAAPRRTLASEIARRRQDSGGAGSR